MLFKCNLYRYVKAPRGSAFNSDGVTPKRKVREPSTPSRKSGRTPVKRAESPPPPPGGGCTS
jgi:hypothetical protein